MKNNMNKKSKHINLVHWLIWNGMILKVPLEQNKIAYFNCIHILKYWERKGKMKITVIWIPRKVLGLVEIKKGKIVEFGSTKILKIPIQQIKITLMRMEILLNHILKN